MNNNITEKNVLCFPLAEDRRFYFLSERAHPVEQKETMEE